MRRLTLVVVLAASACTVIPEQQSPVVHDFGLPVPNPSLVAFSPDAQLTVQSPDWLNDNRVRYRFMYDSPEQVRYYAFHQWIAPPPALLAQHLKLALQDIPESLVLEFLGFEQQFTKTDHAKVVLQFSVTATSKGIAKKGRQKIFKLEKDCLTADIYGAISAAAELAKISAIKLREWLLYDT